MPCDGVHFLLIAKLPNALFNLVLKKLFQRFVFTSKLSYAQPIQASQMPDSLCVIYLFIYLFYFLKSLFGKFGRILSANYN